MRRLVSERWVTRVFVVMAMASLATPPVSPALAQSDDANEDDADDELDPIQVLGESVDGYVSDTTSTATKTETPIEEVPQSISVITEEQIEDQGSESLEEALRYEPGVLVRPFGRDRRFNQFSVRGFSGTSGNTYNDGLQVANGTFTVPRIEPYGQERIEILRGPSSVLFGSGSPGGIVNTVSKRAPAEFLAEFGLEYGSHNWKQAKVDVGGPLGEGTGVFGRVTALARDAETIIDKTQDDKLFIAPTVRFEPSDRTRLTLLASYQREEQFSFGTLPIEGTLRDNPNGEIDRDFFIGDPNFDDFETERFSAGYELEHRLNDVITLKQKARYAEVTNEQAAVFGNDFQPDLRTLNRSAFTVDDSLDAFTVDNQAHFDFDLGVTEHRLLTGVNYRYSEADNLREFDSAPTIDVFDPSYGKSVPDPAPFIDSETEQEELGFYLQDQITIYDNLLLTLGVRHDTVDQETDDQLAGTSSEFDAEETTYRAGIGYKFPNDITPYLSYSESFEPLLETDATGEPFKPTTAEQVEAGVRYRPENQPLRLTASVYELTEENVKSPDPNNPTRDLQGGEIRSQGLELSAKGRVFESLDFTASYTYLDAEALEQTNSIEEGNEPTVAPENQVKAWADYTVPGGALSGLNIGGGVRYVDESWGDGANTIRNDNYTLVDARIGYEWERIEFELSSRNLTDNDYVVCNGSDTACTFGKARRIRGSITYRW